MLGSNPIKLTEIIITNSFLIPWSAYYLIAKDIRSGYYISIIEVTGFVRVSMDQDGPKHCRVCVNRDSPSINNMDKNNHNKFLL